VKVLALDQASRVSGYAVYDSKLLKCGHFEIKSSLPIEQRMQEFMVQLNRLYREYSFDELVFEDIQLQAGNVKTYKTLAYIQATIIIWCYNNDIKYHIYSPSHWRSVIKEKCGITFGRKRAEQKKAAQDFIKEKFNIDATEDESDACCIGYAYLLDNQSAF